MEAKAWCNGQQTYGIRVGNRNRTQYFNEDWTTITVELDGAFHEFNLTDGFWNKCPEFRDRDGLIRDWLERHKTLDWPTGKPPKVQLVPIGSRRFRLIP